MNKIDNTNNLKKRIWLTINCKNTHKTDTIEEQIKCWNTQNIEGHAKTYNMGAVKKIEKIEK